MDIQHHISIVNAGAGSGKTYTIVERVLNHVGKGTSVSQIMLTTFTKKAAKELRERIKKALIEHNHFEEAQKVDDAWFGTVHSLGKRLIDIFTFEAGYAPNQEVIPEEDENMLFRQAMATALIPGYYKELNQLAEELQVIDWQDGVLEIIKKARENNIDLSNSQACAERSVEVFWQVIGNYLDKTGPQTIEQLLAKLSNVSAGLNQVKARSNSKHVRVIMNINAFIEHYNKKDELSLELFEEINNEKLSSKDQMSQEIFTQARNELNECEVFIFKQQFKNGFKNTYRKYLEILFETANRVYQSYVTYKKQRGLIDYSDQENEFLNLLEKEPVKNYVNGQFKVLMVDEFQDTNPMQLAIFMKLAPLIPETIFVGDPKQSIYGFRGTDLSLINRVSMSDRVIKEKPLDTSRRSRAPLVHFSNTVFEKLFKDLKRDEIVLKPWDKLAEVKEFKPSVQFWKDNEKGKLEVQRTRVVGQLIRLLSSDEKLVIRDKESGKLRKIGYGDIAILCRTNSDVRDWATCLEQHGIKVSAEREDFQLQAEIVFLLAACTYLVNENDTLALTELLVLGDSNYAGNPARIIDERLEWLEKNGEGFLPEKSILIMKLDALRPDLEVMGILGLIEKLIIVTDIYNLSAKWHKAPERRANIQMFLALAEKFEQRCISYNKAMNLHGFINWVKAQEDLKQSPSLAKDAVKVMTNFKAKGLEWPVVILSGLQSELKVSWYGTHAITPEGRFDIYNPLVGREIIHIHSPFGYTYGYKGNEYSNPPEHIKVQIEASEFYAQNREKEIEEGIRIMYVAVTRARDYLIIPELIDLKKDSWWFNTVGSLLPDFFNAETDYNIPCEPVIPVHVERLLLSADMAADDNSECYFSDLVGKKDHDPFRVIPSDFIDENGEQAKDAIIGIKADLNTGRLCNGLNEVDLGNALHAIMAVWTPDTDKVKRLGIIARILDGYELGTTLTSERVDAMCNQFFDWIQEHFPENRLYKELPLSSYSSEQLMHGIADLLIECKDSLTIVDYKSYQGVDLSEHARKYAGQLQAYKTMIEASHPEQKKVRSTLIFYPVTGKIVELK